MCLDKEKFISQVVQQQQVARNTQESGGSVLFNPNTNTRIVYRVIYPSELHKGQQTVIHVTPRGTSATTTSIPVQQTHLPKRQYRKRGKDDEEDKMDGPEMSKEEKEERKKHRPRTRSGRVSKPPKHMVKDYKHIHVLDWDEDYDDSDGGYSDYKGSDEEGHGRSKERNQQLTPELYSGKFGNIFITLCLSAIQQFFCALQKWSVIPVFHALQFGECLLLVSDIESLMTNE